MPTSKSLELPDECVVELPDEGPVVDEFGVGSAVVERKLEVLELPDELELVELLAECLVHNLVHFFHFQQNEL